MSELKQAIEKLFPEKEGFTVTITIDAPIVIIECPKVEYEKIDEWTERSDGYFERLHKAMGEDAERLTTLFLLKNGRDWDFNLYSRIEAPITCDKVGSEFDSSNFNYGDAGIWRPRVFDEFEFKPIKPYKMGKLFSYDGAIYEGEDNFEKFISYLMYTWILEYLHNF